MLFIGGLSLEGSEKMLFFNFFNFFNSIRNCKIQYFENLENMISSVTLESFSPRLGGNIKN